MTESESLDKQMIPQANEPRRSDSILLTLQVLGMSRHSAGFTLLSTSPAQQQNTDVCSEPQEYDGLPWRVRPQLRSHGRGFTYSGSPDTRRFAALRIPASDVTLPVQGSLCDIGVGSGWWPVRDPYKVSRGNHGLYAPQVRLKAETDKGGGPTPSHSGHGPVSPIPGKAKELAAQILNASSQDASIAVAASNSNSCCRGLDWHSDLFPVAAGHIGMRIQAGGTRCD